MSTKNLKLEQLDQKADVGKNFQSGLFSVIEESSIGDNVTIGEYCLIKKGAKIGNNVCIGARTTVHPNVEIGDNTEIGESCELGVPTSLADSKKLVISKDSHIRSKSIFYIGSTFDEGLVTGHCVTVRENIVAGKGFQIGSFSDLQGDSIFGDYVRLQTNVFVGKHSKVDNFSMLLPYVVLTNDYLPPTEDLIGPTLHPYTVICAGSIILPGIEVKEHGFVGAGSIVTKDVESYALVVGSPAKKIKDIRTILDKDGNPKYPWTQNYHRGYPDEIVQEWMKGKY